MPIDLYGREAELAQLARLAAAAADDAGSLVLVSGEAGVGKTALVRTALARSGLQRIETAATEAAALAYAPLAAVLRASAADGPPLLAGTPQLRRCLHVLVPELAGEPEGDASPAARDQRLLFDAIAAAFAELASRGPLAVFVDDLHWADAATLDAIGHLAAVVTRLPLLIVAAYRSEDVTREHRLRHLRTELRRAHALNEISLRPLTAPAATELISARLGARPSPELVGQLMERTEGIPFFLEELTTAVAESGTLEAGSAGLSLRADAGLPLPESVRDAVLQRVDRLPDEVREMLAVAAVAGPVLDQALASSSSAHLPATGLLVEDAAGRLVFRHALIRDALYEAIPWARRRALHRECAERLTASGAPPQAVARHWLAAGDTATAGRCLVAAARLSHAACAYRDAVAQLSQAVELWPPHVDDAERLDALELLARCAELSGAPAAAVRALTELVDHLESQPDRFRLAEAERLLASSLEAQGAWERALTARQIAASAYVAAGRPSDAAAEFLAAAARLRSAASFAASLEMIDAGIAQAVAAGRRDLIGRLRALEGNVRARAGSADVGLPIVREALSRALETSDVGTAAEAYQRLADSLEHAGDYRGARSTYLEAADFCQRGGAATIGEVCLACLTVVLRQTGEWDEAVKVCHDVIGSASSNAHALAVAHGILGSILAHRGQHGAARAALHDSNVLARRIGLAAMEIDSETNLARLAAVLGRDDEAIERCWRAVRTWQRTERERHYSVPNLRWIASFASASGRDDLLSACVAALVAIASEPDVEARAAEASGLGEAALRAGDVAGGVANLERAVALYAELELPFERAEAAERAAAANAQAGRRAQAVRHYRDAHRTARHLGARRLAEQLASGLAAMGESVERRLGRLAASGLHQGGLTSRELEVARLVASGLTSREVAGTLHLSPRTVEMHVHRILTKLDCRNRVDITRRIAELGLLA